MLVVSLMIKYKKYLRRVYRALRILQAAERFSVLFLLLILFDGYKLVHYSPELNTFVKTQAYTDPYRFNIILMAIEAWILTPVVGIVCRLINREKKVGLVDRLERNFPELRTKLSTACDNRPILNIVTKKLFEDVHTQLYGIKIRNAIPGRQIIKSLMIFLLASGAAFFCIYEDFSFEFSPGRLMDEILEELPEESLEENVSELPVYGPEAVIIKNGEKVEMEINPGLGLGFTSQVDLESKPEFEGNSSSSKGDFRYGQTYTENLPEEYEPMIKQYFEELSS